MKQVQEGLFAMEEQMPCTPGAVVITRYALPSTLDGKEDQEEAAARILSFSQDLDRWVGVSKRRLVETMRKENEMYQRITKARREYLDEYWRFLNAQRRYSILCKLTLGVYARFVAQPELKRHKIPDAELPVSGIFAFGLQYVIIGIRGLVERGLLREEMDGNGGDALTVYFPTHALITRIMKAQGIAAN